MARTTERDDDRPRRKAKSSGMPTWGWVLLGVSGLVFIGGFVMCAGMLWMGKKAGEKAQDDLTITQKKLDDEREKERSLREQDVLFVENKKADLTLAQFKVQRPKTPTTIRVQVKLADYWNYEYGDSKDSHFSFMFDGTNAFGEPAWIPRQSADGKRLYELTKDAKKHWVTIVVQWVGPGGKPTPLGQQGIAIQTLLEEK